MNRKTRITEKELQDLNKELKVNSITKAEIAKKCKVSLRYVQAVFSTNDDRYSENIISNAKKLLIQKSNKELNAAVEKHSSTMKIV